MAEEGENDCKCEEGDGYTPSSHGFGEKDLESSTRSDAIAGGAFVDLGHFGGHAYWLSGPLSRKTEMVRWNGPVMSLKIRCEVPASMAHEAGVPPLTSESFPDVTVTTSA